MNTTLFIMGCCNVAIGGAIIRNKGYKRNYIAFLNILLGLLLIIFSVTIFKHAE